MNDVRAKRGITLIELLIVIAIIAIIAGIGAISGRGIAQRASERAAINTVQQAVWQGATLAAARGFRTELVRVGDELRIRRVSDGNILRRYELDGNVVHNLPDGMVLEFTPPGAITSESLDALGDLSDGGIRLTVAGTTYAVEVSLIGEVRVR